MSYVHPTPCSEKHLLTLYTGEDSSCPARPREDPLPGLQSGVPEVFRCVTVRTPVTSPLHLCAYTVGTWDGAWRAAVQIYSDNGVRGLLQGHSATLLRIFPYAAIKFIAYDQIENVGTGSSRRSYC